ncbi:MAG: hypothetical protein K0R58_796 [Ramlibacter sp.]|jgi:hypothetical protein|nr:hypothetical protein [Ramlibacter sp.]
MHRQPLPGFALALLLACSFPAAAQAFPEGASPLSAAEIKQRLVDRVLDVKLADGVTWRLEYKSNGYFFVNTSRGFNGSGPWSAEDGKLCGQLQGAKLACNEVRLHQDIVHYKRDSGEIIRLVPR